MIETYNNIIFWIGYLFLSSILLTLSIYLIHACIQEIVTLKKFFIAVYNKQFDKRIEGMSEKDIDQWLEAQKEKWREKNN